MAEEIGKPDAAKDLSLFEGQSDHPLVGKVLDSRWKILKFLGEGSMSVVYQAEHLQSGELVVLKVLHHHPSVNTSRIRRFDTVAKQIIGLRHPRITRFLDIHLEKSGEIYLVLESVPGESLEEQLAKTGHLPTYRTIEIFTQVCEALEYAHDDNVLHRDLKPSNIILVDSGKIKDDVKVSDFGVAQLLVDDGEDVKTSSYITRTKEVLGSPMYMSPEQCMGKKLDQRSDIYSFGCVLYESLTGKPPFVGKNVLETAYKHMNETPKPIAPDITQDKVLPRLEAVIFKALAKDPNDRYQSVTELKSDLSILSSASEPDWVANTFAQKKTGKLQGKKRGSTAATPATRRWLSFEAAAIGGVALVIIVVVVIWAFQFLTIDPNESRAFNNDLLWVVTDRTKVVEQPDFPAVEEAARTELFRAEHDSGKESKDYANALRNLAGVYVRSGHWSDATPLLMHLSTIYKKLKLDTLLGECYVQIAYVQFMEGQLKEAETNAQLAVLNLEQKRLPPQLLEVPLEILGDIYSSSNNMARAEEIYTKLFALCEPNKTTDTSGFIKAAAKLGDIYRRENKLQQAEDLYAQSIDVYRSVNNRDSPFIAKALYGMGLVLQQENKNREAEADFHEAQAVCNHLAINGSAQNSPEFVNAVKKHCKEMQWKTNPIGALQEKITGNGGTIR